MWPDSMPSEVHEELAAQRELETSTRTSEASPQRPKPVRSSAPTAPPLEDASATAPTKNQETQKPSTPRKRGHLRVVK